MKTAIAAWLVVATMLSNVVTATVTSASSSSNEVGNVAANVIDGSFETRWATDGDGEWLMLTMDKEYELSGVTLAFYLGNARSAEFKIDVSTDGTTWTSAVAQTSSSGTTNLNETFDFAAPLTAKYVRYTGYGNSASTWNAVTEFGVVKTATTPTPSTPSTPTPPSTPSTPSPPTGTVTTATSSSNEVGNVAANVLDGNVATRWAAEGDGEWLMLTLSKEYVLSGVTLAVYLGNVRSADFKIDVSTDGTTWTSAVAQTSSSGTTIWNEAFDFAAPMAAKYVRYTGYGNSANNWNAVTKFGVVKSSSATTPSTPTPSTPTPSTRTPSTPTPSTPTPSTPAPSTGTVTTATSSSDDGNVAANVLDGSVLTRWAAEGDGEWLMLTLSKEYVLSGVTLAFHLGNERTTDFKIDVSTDATTWTSAVAQTSSSGATVWNQAFDFAAPMTAKYVRYTGYGNSENDWNSVTKFGVVKSSSATTPSTPTPSTPSTPTPPSTPSTPTPPAPSTPLAPLDADAPPSDNFDLREWYLSVPSDTDGSGTADDVKEGALNAGYEHSTYFYTASDGGMVFYCPIDGYKTSSSTSYTRTELREMLRAGDTSISTSGVNENNWVLSSAPSDAQDDAGGVDGTLTATLAVNHVTTTGDDSQVGRVIVGQIHGEDDEPCRVYYRKLPNHSKGSVYFASEERGGDSEEWVDLIGSRSDDASDPSDGVELGELWGYEIKTVGNTLTVTITRSGKDDVWKSVTMKGYDVSDEYLYFKAGVYNQNNSGDDDDYVQATFYALTQTH